jgi:hypothetical protein
LLFHRQHCVGLFISWDVQKFKADERFKSLRDGDYEAYCKHSERVQQRWYLRNYVYDRTAAGAIIMGFVVELFSRLIAAPAGH